MRFVPLSGFITLLRSRDVVISHYDCFLFRLSYIQRIENEKRAIFYTSFLYK